MVYYFRNKSSIIDVQLGYIKTSKNIEVFNVKLRQSKSSRLLQRLAFLVLCSIYNFKYEIYNSNTCKYLIRIPNN